MEPTYVISNPGEYRFNAPTTVMLAENFPEDDLSSVYIQIDSQGVCLQMSQAQRMAVNVKYGPYACW